VSADAKFVFLGSNFNIHKYLFTEQGKEGCTFVALFLACFLEKVPDMKDLVFQYNASSTV
jgi:hypothetical protein